jgi:hypothetical protein
MTIVTKGKYAHWNRNARFDMVEAKFISGGFQGKVPGLQVEHLN